MSTGISKVHGQVAPGAFYGYSPVVVLITESGKFTADTVAANGVITEGGYAKATKVVQTFGSIVWLGAQASGTFCAIIDSPTLNAGDGAGGNAGATTGFAALKAALVAALGSGTYAVTTSTALNGAGTFTFA
jgi:hypothetical protein